MTAATLWGATLWTKFCASLQAPDTRRRLVYERPDEPTFPMRHDSSMQQAMMCFRPTGVPAAAVALGVLLAQFVLAPLGTAIAFAQAVGAEPPVQVPGFWDPRRRPDRPRPTWRGLEAC